MVRTLTLSDTADALELLRRRPLQNVFLEYVVSAGVLGRVPGFFGYRDSSGELGGIVMIGPLGGTALEVRDPAAFAPLARAAADQLRKPRHIVGPADVTEPFWTAFEPLAGKVVWDRVENVFVIERDERVRAEAAADGAHIEPATFGDLDAIVVNSGRQHVEDLNDDRLRADPHGFRDRHARDVRDGRWWVLRSGGRIVCQLHVGAENAVTVQLGGVATPPDLRNRGFATRAVAAIALRLLERRPAVSLFCDAANTTARRVYERVGFYSRFPYHSWLLEPEDATLQGR